MLRKSTRLQPPPDRTSEIAEDIHALFNGSYAWVARLLLFLSLLLLAVLIWVIVRFVQADSLDALIKWGVGLICLVQGIFFIEIWFWMELHTQRLLRQSRRHPLREDATISSTPQREFPKV